MMEEKKTHLITNTDKTIITVQLIQGQHMISEKVIVKKIIINYKTDNEMQ